MTIDEYFSTGPPHERPVFDEVLRRLDGIGPIHIEPVSVGIFLKRAKTFVELRPMTKWVAVSFSLRRVARHRLITRRVVSYGSWFWHVANVAGPDEIDDDLIGLMAEAYFESPSGA